MSNAHWAASNAPQPGRMSGDQAAQMPVYRRLFKAAKAEYQSDLDPAILGLMVADTLEDSGVGLHKVCAITVDEFAKRWKLKQRTPETSGSPKDHSSNDGRGGPAKVASKTTPLYAAIKDKAKQGMSVKQIVTFIGTPEGKSIREMVKIELKRKPLTKTRSQRKQTTVDVVNAALASTYPSRSTRPKR